MEVAVVLLAVFVGEGVGFGFAVRPDDLFHVGGGAGEGVVHQDGFVGRGGDSGDGSDFGVGDASGGEGCGDVGRLVRARATRRCSRAGPREMPHFQLSQWAGEWHSHCWWSWRRSNSARSRSHWQAEAVMRADSSVMWASSRSDGRS